MSKDRGIYVLDKGNGKKYVGQSEDFERRYTSHHKNQREEMYNVVDEDVSLDDAEQAIIRAYQEKGIELTNVAYNRRKK